MGHNLYYDTSPGAIKEHHTHYPHQGEALHHHVLLINIMICHCPNVSLTIELRLTHVCNCTMHISVQTPLY